MASKHGRIFEQRPVGAQGPVEVAQLDLADLASVARFEAKLEAEPRLDTLVCNAGVMMCPFQHTKDGFEMQIGTNHFGASMTVQTVVRSWQGLAAADQGR